MNGGAPFPLAAGQVQFFDYFLPALSAGSYTLSVTPTLTDPHGGTQFPTFGATTQALGVTAPHYTLDPGLIFSQFPPPGGASDFGQYLPQIVLTHPKLAWIRRIQSDQPPQTPWLALLMFQASEMNQTGKGGTLAQSGQVGTVLDPNKFPAGYAKPAVAELDPLVDPTTQCQFIDMPATLFANIAPKLGELPLLAHYRQVNTSTNQVSGDSENGAYAVVIGNRLPKAAELLGPAPEPWIVHLVSLENYVACLPGGGGPSFQTIRLVSLASWTFTSVKTKHFSGYMKGLSLDMLRLPQPPKPSNPTPSQQTVLTAAGNGYVPMSYEPREGERTAGWYRGPLAAAAIAPAHGWLPFVTADAALVYDATTGMFDLSYAIAWQIGRLLALADAKFCSALIAYRARAAQTVLRYDIRNQLAARFPTTLALSDDAVGRLAPRAASAAARAFLFNHLPDVLENHVLPAFAARADRYRVADRLDKLPGVLAPADLADLHARGGDPVHALMSRLLPGHARAEEE